METSPKLELVSISHKRWRHKQKKHVVVVFDVHNFFGEHGFFSIVHYHDHNRKEHKQPAALFLKSFEPIGRPIVRLSRWKRLV